MRWETHCHTIYSTHRSRILDAVNTPGEMIKAAIRRRLQGLIITDHDSVKGGLVGRRISARYDSFSVIPGSEITSLSGHILAIGIDRDVPRNLSLEETIEKIHDNGGIAVASHPFSETVRRSSREECSAADAIEVFNSHNTETANQSAYQFAKKLGKPVSAGSDAHWARHVGYAGIVCDNPVEDLRKGRIEIFGCYAPRRDFVGFSLVRLERSLRLRILSEKSLPLATFLKNLRD